MDTGFNIYQLALASFGLFALFHFLLILIPMVTQRFKLAPSVTKGAIFALSDFLRTFFLITTLVAITSIGLLFVVEYQGGATTDQVWSAINRIQTWHDTLESISPTLSWAIIVFLFIALAIMSYRGGKARMEQAQRRQLDLELKRLQKERNDGKWEELPPSPEMKVLLLELEKRENVFQQASHELEKVENAEDKQKLEETRSLIEQEIDFFTAQFQHLDLMRRMNLNIRPDDVKLPVPNTRWERVQTFFIGRSLLASLSGGSRFIFFVGLLFLIPALLAVAFIPLGQQALLQKKSVLEQRYTEIDLEEAKAGLEQIKQPGSELVQLTEEDHKTLDQIAYFYEREIARDIAEGITSQINLKHQARTRERILNHVAARTTDDDNNLTEAIVYSVEGGSLGRLTMDLPDMSNQRQPVTEVGRQFRADLEHEVDKLSPEQWKSIKLKTHNFASSHQVATHQVRSMVFTHLSDLDNLGGVDSEIDKLAKEMDTIVDSKTRQHVHQTQSHKFIVALSQEGGSFDDALHTAAGPEGRPPFTEAKVAQMKKVAQRIPSTAQIEAKLRLSPPSLVFHPEPGIVNLDEASRLSGRMVAHAYPPGTSPSLSAVDALASFDDFFPGQQGAETQTKRHQTLRKAGVIEKPTSISRVDSRRKFTMARSYTRLSGFRRIGGVLIGREPDTTSTPVVVDFRDIQWKSSGQRTTLKLSRGDGEIIQLGPFQNSIIHLALGYAADGRPVTVTMVKAEPLRELKILLHPGLVDTALGCRAIELDRFVDQYSGDNSKREEAERRVKLQGILYELAWSTHFLALFNEPIIADKLQNLPPSRIDSLIAGMKAPLDSAKYLKRLPEINSLIAPALDAKILADPKQSPLTVKKAFFNQGIVDTLISCVTTQNAVLDNVLNCIELKAKEKAYNVAMDDTFRWAAPPPEFIHWSGVRELSYKIDPDLAFVNVSLHKDTEQLWPFEFVIQLAPSTPPYLVDSRKAWFSEDNQDIYAYSDENPWDFPALKETLKAVIADNIAKNSIDRSIFEDMREFTVLQRLFRVALDGGLGKNFPIDKLSALAKQTGGSVKYHRTLRWNVRPGKLEYEMVASLQEILPELEKAETYKPVLAAIKGCIKFATLEIDGLLGRKLAKIAQEDWDNSCNFENFKSSFPELNKKQEDLSGTAALIQDIVFMTIRTSYARRIRKALGVAKDDEQILKQRTCPAP